MSAESQFLFVTSRHAAADSFIMNATPLSFINHHFRSCGSKIKEMATKPSKPRKTTSAKQGAAQPRSTVAPIAQGTNVADAGGHPFQPAEHRSSGDQRIEEEIRIRAYELFEQRGRLEGFHHEDWARAEAEVLAKYRRDKSA